VSIIIFFLPNIFYSNLEQNVEERVKVPWPVSDREALLHFFEIEYLKEDLVLVLVNTVNMQLYFIRSSSSYLYYITHKVNVFLRSYVILTLTGDRKYVIVEIMVT
jgi:hypothetical protein